MSKKIIPFFILFTLLAFQVWAENDSVVTIHISFVGDIMCHSSQFNNARAGKESFDFNPSFSEVKPWLEDQDANPDWPAHVRATLDDLLTRLDHGV